MILEVFSCGPIETNTILLGCSTTKKGVVIDVPFDSTQQIIQGIKKFGLEIEAILLTHSHWDHIGEVEQLKERLKVPVYIHKEDFPNLETPGSDGLGAVPTIKGVIPDHFLQDGETLRIGELQIKVIHTPGHTPGGVCFYLEQEKVLISGDTLFQGTIGNLSSTTARPALMWESLKKLARLPADTRVIPGHGDETTIGDESWIIHAKERFGF